MIQIQRQIHTCLRHCVYMYIYTCICMFRWVPQVATKAAHHFLSELGLRVSSALASSAGAGAATAGVSFALSCEARGSNMAVSIKVIFGGCCDFRKHPYRQILLGCSVDSGSPHPVSPCSLHTKPLNRLVSGTSKYSSKGLGQGEFGSQQGQNIHS